MTPKREIEKVAKKIKFDRIRQAVEANSGPLSDNDPLYGTSESSFRRGFSEALHYCLLFMDLSQMDRRAIAAYLGKVRRWRNALWENGKFAYPPVPDSEFAKKILRSGAKPNPKAKR